MLKPYYSEPNITIYHGDCRDILPTLPKVDLVLTDPPYGLGDKLDGSGNGEWSTHFGNGAPEWDKKIVEGVEKLPSFSTHTIIWGGNYYPLPPTRSWLIWDKMQEHTSGHAELAWTNLDIPIRIFRLSRVEAYSLMNKKHPTQKPEKLLTWCISFCPDAQTILDPFMGSGTTLRACKDLGRKGIGIEIEEKYVEIAIKRLRQEVLPLA